MAKEKEGNWFSRHKVLSVILGLVLIGIIAGAASGGTDTDTTNNSDDTEQSSEEVATTAKVGESARDGKFEFTVSGIECGQKTIGNDEYFMEEAQGEYCVADVKVENIGNEPQTLFASDQYAYNADGQKYSTDSDAVFALDEAQNIFLEEINPGNSVTGQVVFDVPEGTKLVKLELHDSSLSGGVEVKL